MILQVPKCAIVAVAAYSFPEKFSSFSFLSLLTKAEVIAALVKVRAECNKVGRSPSVVTGDRWRCYAISCALHAVKHPELAAACGLEW